MEHSWRRAVNDAATGLAIHNVKRLPKRGESGFTLVEVLVAIVVLSITGLAAAQFAITAIRTSYAQQQRSAAIALGSDGIERMRAQIADHTSAPSGFGGYGHSGCRYEQVHSAGAHYHGQRRQTYYIYGEHRD